MTDMLTPEERAKMRRVTEPSQWAEPAEADPEHPATP